MTHPETDVLVALSGGMDSAAAVLFLREADYRPRALFLDMLDDERSRAQARQTAQQVGVELTVEPCAERFQAEVVRHVLREHAAGRTPSPCTHCNPRIKWRLLVEAADRLGIRHIATGHYVQKETYKGHACFRRGIDPSKDQSYYLWEVPEAWIRRALLPLGGFTKEEVRRRLREQYGLEPLAAQRESMGICFTAGMRYEAFLRQALPPETMTPGEVTDTRGRVIGAHEGYPFYTAGQKRGFTLQPTVAQQGGTWAVQRVEARENRIVVCRPEELYSRTLWLSAWRAVSPAALFDHPEHLSVVVRGLGRNPQGGCILDVEESGLLRVTLTDDRAWAVMPGQPVVFYRGDCVVGGGILEHADYSDNGR